MNIRRTAYVAAVACTALVLTKSAPAQDTAPRQESRSVIELFTSQGCSSCPAADRLLGELAGDPSLVTLTLAVDYWDYLGWKDTLALHGHTVRQRAYSGARGDRQVYTPQAVVNGAVHVLGSDRSAIDQAILKTRGNGAPLPVGVQVAGDKITVTVAAAKDDRRSGEIWLCPVTSKVSVVIGRGENNGRSITYHNVVRRWVKLGDWNGETQSFSASVADLANANVAAKDIDRVAVVVQAGVPAKPGPMLGAAIAAVK